MDEVKLFSERLKDVTIRCSFRLNYVIFPINVYEMFDALRDSGYEITTPPLPPKPAHAPVNIGFSGPFATKNGNILDGNSDRAFFGVASKSFESSYDGLNDFISVINEELGINLSDIVVFYEVLSNFSCSSKKDPVKNISSVFNDCKIIPKIDRILKKEVSLYNIRIVPKGVVPNQNNWFDITIEPDNINPTRLNIRVVFRNEDASIFEEFGRNMIHYLGEIIEEIES